jgi:hypothetical protein
VGLRVRIPLGTWMFVLCVSYKRQSQNNQDKEVQLKYSERKKIPPGAWMFVLGSKDKKAKAKTKQYR